MIGSNIFNNINKIHFIGIGGVSMSGLAAVSLSNNIKVSGSDGQHSDSVKRLEKMGATVFIGHSAENIANDVDLVVYTAAIASDNPELVKAYENSIKVMDRAEFLGLIMRGYKKGIAVAGTHGKTTTTSMSAHALISSMVDPTVLVGGDLSLIEGNYKIGKSEYFVTEACEYKQSFLKFFPYIGIILNIDEDHLDFYKDINHIKDTFKSFIDLIPSDGYAIVNIDDINVPDVIKNAKCNIIKYGINSGDITAKNIVINKRGCASFDVFNGNTQISSITLNVPGMHNVYNTLSVIAMSVALDLPLNLVEEGLASFKGADKRFQYKGTLNGIDVIDDYAHHPVEIKATLGAAKTMDYSKIYCVFQPHTYTRTLSLFDDFTMCFDDADTIILLDIYAAREKDNGEISSMDLGDALRKRGLDCINLHSHKDAADYLEKIVCDGSIILTVGAGDVVKVGEIYLNK